MPQTVLKNSTIFIDNVDPRQISRPLENPFIFSDGSSLFQATLLYRTPATSARATKSYAWWRRRSRNLRSLNFFAAHTSAAYLPVQRTLLEGDIKRKAPQCDTDDALVEKERHRREETKATLQRLLLTCRELDRK